MTISTEEYFDRLNELLLEKKILLEQLLSLTVSQAGTISEAGMDRLSSLIEGKQQRIDALNKLDDTFQLYLQRLKSKLGMDRLDQLEAATLRGTAVQAAGLLKQQTAEIMDLLKRIQELERENGEKSRRLLDQFSEEVRRINQQKQASRAYRPVPKQTPSYFMDKKK